MSANKTLRNLLFIAYEFPPSAGGGVQRVTKFARYLAESGWSPTVLAAVPVVGRPTDETLLGSVAAVPVVRLPARHVSTLFARALRPLKTRRRVAEGDAGHGGGRPGPTAPLATRLSRAVAVPDDAVYWGRSVVGEAVRLHRESAFDAILASGPPYSSLVAAVRAGAVLGLPVVLDLRDPWRDNIALRWPTRAHAARSLWLERFAMSGAQAVTAVSRDIAEEAGQMGARDVTVIPNGFDAADIPPRRPDPEAPLRVAFMGRLSTSVSDPAPFFEAVRAAGDREASCREMRVDVVGPDAPWAVALAHSVGIADQVVFHGFRSHAEALRIVASADVGLILISEGPGSEAIYSGKLFEYLGLGIPVLLCGPANGAAADLIREARAGEVVGSRDADAIADALARFAVMKGRGEVIASPDPAVVRRYDRRSQAADLAAVLDRAVAHG